MGWALRLKLRARIQRQGGHPRWITLGPQASACTAMLVTIERQAEACGFRGTSPGNCCFYQFFEPIRQGDGKGELMAARAHLAPGLADDVDELVARVVRVVAGEIAELSGKEAQAGGVFERLGFGVAIGGGLSHQQADAFAGYRIHAGGEQNLLRTFTLAFVHGLAPGQVTRLVHRERRAGNGPAFQVLSTGGETQRQ